MLARLVVNLAIKAVLLLVFNYFGWLHVLDRGQPVRDWSWSAFMTALLIAVVFVVMNFVVMRVWVTSTILTLGLGLILLLALPFLGYFLLWIVSSLMPDMLQIGGFWITALCGLLLLVVAIPAPASSTPPTTA